jgi:hypothetical protein
VVVEGEREVGGGDARALEQAGLGAVVLGGARDADLTHARRRVAHAAAV